jgi:hypothetical protein
VLLFEVDRVYNLEGDREITLISPFIRDHLRKAPAAILTSESHPLRF